MNRFLIPSIADINKNAGSNGLTVISTFAGGGGSSTGYKIAGYKVKVAVEFVDKAADTYRANAPDTVVIEGDIRNVTAEQLLQVSGLKVGELDVFDGSPPCQGFAHQGLRSKGWGEELHYSGSVSQRVDDLFFEFVRLVDGLKPKVFVAENVAGLTNGVAAGYFKEFFKAFEDIGYKVEAQMIEGARLGVPQMRNRIIFIGVRNDLGMSPVFPMPFPKGQLVGLREAVEGLPDPVAGECMWLKEGTRTRRAWEVADVLEENGCFTYSYRKLGWCNGKKSRWSWFRLPPNRPVNTVTAKTATICHWDQPRTLSIPELKRVSTFPDDYVLTGGFNDQWERIGRAVPPAMMFHIANAIAVNIFGKPNVVLPQRV